MDTLAIPLLIITPEVMRVSVLYPFPTERTWCHCLHLCSVLWAPLVRHFISVGEEPQHPEEGSSEVSCCSKGIHQNKCMLKGRIYETLEFLGCWLLNHVCHVISQIINSPMSSIILISHRVVILTTNSFKRLVFYINTTMGIKEKGGACFSLWKEIIMDSVLYLMGL